MQKEYTAIDLARASVAPRNYQCLPPSTTTLASFSKRLDAIGNFNVNDTALVGEQVPTSSGAVIWWPFHGAGSIYRFGIVAANTSVVNPGGVLYAGSTPVVTYLSPTMIPYGTTSSINDIVRISPPLTSDIFSKLRVVAGDIRMSCDTVPIGNTALNGVFAAAAIGDIRDVLQTGYTTGVVSGSTLDVSQMMQTAVTQKDGVKEISGFNGVRVLVGPDIPSHYGPPDSTACDFYMAGPVQEVIIGPGGANFVAQASAPTLAPGAYVPCFAALISPWNMHYADTYSPSFTPYNYNYGPIDPFSVLDIHFAMFGYTQTNQPAGYIESWWVYATAVFATTDSTGAVTYNYWYDYFPGYANSINNEWSLICDLNFKQYQGSLNGGNNSAGNNYTLPLNGMYLFTYIQVVVANETVVTPNGPSGFIYGINMSIRPRNLYQPGSLGPCRIIKYDGFTTNQNLRLDSVFIAECIPGGTSAPFTQLAAQTSEVCMNLSALPFLTELYNGMGPFRRVWTISEHTDFLKIDLKNFTNRNIGGFGQRKLMIAAKNAGLLEDENDDGEAGQRNKRTRIDFTA